MQDNSEKLRAHSAQIHRVFVQNPDGADLLKGWIENILKAPVITDTSTQFGAGIAEGQRTFIRHIIQMTEVE